MGARHPAEVFAGTAGCRAVVHGGTDGDGRGRSCPRRVPAGCRGDWVSSLWRRAGRVGSCPCPADRWAGRSGSAAARPLPGVRGDARVVAGDRVGAQSVCGGTDLDGVDGPCRWVGASPDRRGDSGAGGHGAGLAAPCGRPAGGDPGVVCDGSGEGRGGRGDPGRGGVRVAGCAGRGRAGHYCDPIPVRCGRVGRRGDAGCGGCGGQWRAAAGTGLASGWRCNTSRP